MSELFADSEFSSGFHEEVTKYCKKKRKERKKIFGISLFKRRYFNL